MVHDTSMSDLAAGEGEEEDTGVYAESYKNATWIYIGDSEEMHVWQKPETKGEEKGNKTFESNLCKFYDAFIEIQLVGSAALHLTFKGSTSQNVHFLS